MPDRAARPKTETAAERLVAGYRPVAGVHDEMMAPDGSIRPAWRPYLSALGALGTEEIARRFAAADRYMRDSGVFYRVYDGMSSTERPWPLAHLPILISAEDWAELSAGLVQRAELMETLLADLYGQGKFIADGVVPAAAVAGSPDFLRPLVGEAPKGEQYLSLYAADVGRGPDGRWWVISDRTQAPSGMGYALENRMALSRALSDVYRVTEVQRLASFFQAYKTQLSSYTDPGSARVSLLTPGPFNETYFEHSLLARYLGFLLVEGADLTVVGEKVFLRTVGGLMQTDVLVRRLDSDFSDPLELNAASRLGVPGLVRAVKAGNVAVANALGSGVAESRSLLGFLPSLARLSLDEDLTVPNVATWWCGQPRERDHVLERFDELVIAPAFGTTVRGVLETGPVLGGELSGADRAKLVDAIRRRGQDFVGQESVTLSTTPVFQDGRMVPRPMMLRVFVAATPGGWTVMPGAFSRIGHGEDVRAVSMQRGGVSADVWVKSDGPVDATTLIPSPDSVPIKRQVGSLPSRAADNMFWLGRYMERTDAALRLVRAHAGRMVDYERTVETTLGRIVELMASWGLIPREKAPKRAGAVAALALGGKGPGAIPALTQASRACAASIRDRLSPDAWRTVVDLADLFADPVPLGSEAEAFERTNHGLRLVSAFAGLVQENMNRLTGWRFLQLGRRLERAIGTCRYLRVLAEEPLPPGALDVVLELGDSQITYRQRYVIVPARVPVLDLLTLDVNNPRSVAYQADRLKDIVGQLPGHSDTDVLTASQRLVARLSTMLRTTDAVDIDADQLFYVERDLMHLSDELARQYFTAPAHMVRKLEGWA